MMHVADTTDKFVTFIVILDRSIIQGICKQPEELANLKEEVAIRNSLVEIDMIRSVNLSISLTNQGVFHIITTICEEREE